MYNRDQVVNFTLIGIVIGLLIGLLVFYLIPPPNKDDAVSIIAEELQIIINELHRVNQTLEGISR